MLEPENGYGVWKMDSSQVFPHNQPFIAAVGRYASTFVKARHGYGSGYVGLGHPSLRLLHLTSPFLLPSISLPI